MERFQLKEGSLQAMRVKMTSSEGEAVAYVFAAGGTIATNRVAMDALAMCGGAPLGDCSHSYPARAVVPAMPS